MPLREFKCIRNGHVTERIQSHDRTSDLIPCPICRHWAYRVEFSQTAPPILKGEGFYKPSVSANGPSDTFLGNIETVTP
jgi:predicted nucleic acid-binding Zn ribbon protein